MRRLPLEEATNRSVAPFPHLLQPSLNARPLQHRRNETEPLPLVEHRDLVNHQGSMQKFDYMFFINTMPPVLSWLLMNGWISWTVKV